MDCDLELSWCVVGFSFGALSLVLFWLSVLPTQFYQVIIHLKSKFSPCSTRLIILYCLLLRTLSMVIHYLVLISTFNIFYLLMECCHCIYDTVVIYYFIDEISKISGKPAIRKQFGLPLLSINIVYSCGFAVYAVIYVVSGDHHLFDCNNIAWGCLSVIHAFLVVSFCIVGRRLS